VSLDKLRKVAEWAGKWETYGPAYVATFDPPTVMALLDVAEAAEAHVTLDARDHGGFFRTRGQLAEALIRLREVSS
jgi:hypothetical protein